MNIFFDHQIFAMQKHGGVSRYFCRLAQQLARSEGGNVRVFAPLHVNDLLANLPEGIRSGVQLPRIPATSRLLRMINQAMTVREIRGRQPDIYHATYFAPPAGVVRASGAKLVVTVYDMVHELFPDAFSAHDQSAAHKAKAVRQADKIICISGHTREDLLRIYEIDPDRVATVHLGFELNVRLTPEPARDQAPYLLYVGTRGGYKNFERFLRAYAQAASIRQDYSLLCFGGGPFSRKESALFRRLGLSDKQVAHQSGDDARLAAAYRGAAAFVYPSQYEGFGFPPLEAMSFDCPVICSKGGSIPEVVGDAGAYFDPGSEQDMVSAMTSVLESDHRRQQLIALGRDQLKRYSWAKCAAQTMNIYRELL